MFALETEALFASLANILKDHRNIDVVSPNLENSSLEPLEVRPLDSPFYYNRVWS
jgi:hypothetical protein